MRRRFGRVGGAEKLEIFDDDTQLAALPAAVLVVPGVVLQPALNEQLLALVAILLNDLGLLSEGGALDKRADGACLG